MKTVTTLRNHKFNNQLARSFKSLSKRMLKLYCKQGETENCIDSIENEVLKLCFTSLDSDKLLQNISPLDRYVSEDNGYYIIRVVDTSSLKVAMHIAPSGTKIPIHSHPGSINALLVKVGGVDVQQCSKPGFNDRQRIIRLTNNECSAGLQRYYNLHSLETTEYLNVFFSIRCKVVKPSYNSLFTKVLKVYQVGLPNKLKIACAFGLLISPSYGCGFTDFMEKPPGKQLAYVDTSKRVSFTSNAYQGSAFRNDMHDRVKQANKIRSESNDDDQYLKAFQLYLQAAKKENAEAQYWLSVMYLKGMGVTNDDEKALHWVSVSADQNYEPAQDLLNYLLTYDEALDC